LAKEHVKDTGKWLHSEHTAHTVLLKPDGEAYTGQVQVLSAHTTMPVS
jgi:hypothetical protein